MDLIKQSVASVIALLLSVAILLTGNGLQGTLLPARANLERFSHIGIGVLGSCYFVGFTLGALAGPALIARVGHIRSYLALVSVASTIVLVHALIVEPMLWWVLRAFSGFCFAALFVVIESWLSERSHEQMRSTVFSIYTILTLTVVTVGQMMLALANPKSFTLFAVVSILVSLAALPVALTRSQSPEPVRVFLPKLWRLYSSSPVGFLGCLAYGLAIGAFWTLGPVFALEAGFGTGGVALFMSATVLGGALGQWPIGRLSDKTDRRLVILWSSALAALAAFSISSVHNGMPTLFFGLGFSFGVFAFPLYALSVAHANDFASETEYVETSSGLLLVFGVGAVAGPTLASLLRGVVQQHPLFLYAGVVYMLMACLVFVRMRQRSPVSQEEKVHFDDALIVAKTFAPIEIIEAPKDTQLKSSDQ